MPKSLLDHDFGVCSYTQYSDLLYEDVVLTLLQLLIRPIVERIAVIVVIKAKL